MGDSVEAAYAASIAHLDQLKATAAVSAGPCKGCRHATWGSWSVDRQCRHPFVRRGEFDVQSGKTTWRYEGQSRVRGYGVCGERGALFQPASRGQIAWRAITPWWPLWVFLIVLAAMLTPLLLLAP